MAGVVIGQAEADGSSPVVDLGRAQDHGDQEVRILAGEASQVEEGPAIPGSKHLR